MVEYWTDLSSTVRCGLNEQRPLIAFQVGSLGQPENEVRAQRLISVSRPPRALILRARRKTKHFCPVRFCQMLGRWRPLPGIPAL